jgi:3',5'-cyclic-AMP phosphodiesterase
MPKILQITDMHILPQETDTLNGINTELSFQRVLADAHKQHGTFDLMLLSGDLAETPSLAVYQRIANYLRQFQTPVICLPGNHDDWSLMQAVFNHPSLSCRKHWLLSNWQIICLNSQKIASPSGELTAAELEFLENCLVTHAEKPTLIAVHHHCIPCESPWLDSMQISNSERLWEILNDHIQVKAVICGHIHQAMSVKIAGINVYSTPSSCFQFKANSRDFMLENAPPGYRILSLEPDGGLSSACYWVAC